MTQMLILVHGMGAHPAGWSDDPGGPKAKLNEVSRRYEKLKTGKAFTDRLVVEEIAYDFCFEEMVNQWQAKSADLGAWATSNARPLPKVLTWLQKTLPADEKTAQDFFWSTAIEPLLYRGFALIRDRVRVAVLSALVDLLQKAGDEAVNVTIVAHSLGTAVMHDVLDLLASGKLADKIPEATVFMPEQWKFSNLFMIADVCLLGPAQTRDIDCFASIVRPVMPDGSKEGYCHKFFEVWHRFDPFAIAAPFRPGDWGPGYQPIGPLSHFRQANVHGFTHYLDHPAVHIPIINYALGLDAVPAAEEAAARAGYADIVSTECSEQIKRVQAKAKDFDQLGNDLEEMAIRIAEFYAVARDAASKCKGIS